MLKSIIYGLTHGIVNIILMPITLLQLISIYSMKIRGTFATMIKNAELSHVLNKYRE